MSIRLAIHVGPHKTGSTSVQRAFAAARDALADGGVWYPPSVADAAWPEQHADVWLLLRSGRDAAFADWLDAAHGEAARRGCDTLLLSSENFHVPRTRRALSRLLSGWRRDARGDTRLIYVRRDLADLACSRALSHITGETGFYFRQRYDLRRWARHFAVEQVRHERWFRRRGARFVPLVEGPRSSLAARLLEAACDRPFPGIVNGDDNVTARGLAGAGPILSYGLRVMHHYATGQPVNTPASHAATGPMLGSFLLDESAFATLTEGFRAGVIRDVREGIEEFGRLSAFQRQWRVWFERTDVGGRLRD